MRKLSIIISILLWVMMLTGCFVSDASDEGKNVDESKSTAQTTSTIANNDEKETENTGTEKKIDSGVSLEEQIILDQDGILITVKSLDTKSLFGPEIKLAFENSSDEPVMIQTRNSSVNGIMVDFMLSCEIDAGKKANDSITIFGDALRTADIQVIKDIEFNFVVMNKDSWDTLFDSETIQLTTQGSDSYTQQIDRDGFTAFDQDDVKVIVKQLDDTDSFWGADLYLLVENNRDQNITIQLSDTSINGYMVDPIFSCDVLVGKIAFDEITFLESDLEENEIETIEELEFKLKIFDMDSWDDIINSDAIVIAFEE